MGLTPQALWLDQVIASASAWRLRRRRASPGRIVFFALNVRQRGPLVAPMLGTTRQKHNRAVGYSFDPFLCDGFGTKCTSQTGEGRCAPDVDRPRTRRRSVIGCYEADHRGCSTDICHLSMKTAKHVRMSMLKKAQQAFYSLRTNFSERCVPRIRLANLLFWGYARSITITNS